MRRLWPLVAPALLALSCARGDKAREPEEVVFWQSWPVEMVQPLVATFEAENPGIHVHLEQLLPDSARERVVAAYEAGAPPDLCGLGSLQVPHFMARGWLSDWSAGVADLRTGLRGWDMCMVGDAIYGLPWMLDTQALFYNKALIARAGLDSMHAPETWEELRAAAAHVHRLGSGVHGYGVATEDFARAFAAFMPFAWGNGGGILSAGLDSCLIDSPENAQALEFLASLRKVGLAASGDSLDAEFVAGRLGLLLAGAPLCARIAREAPGLRYGVGLVPRPARNRGTHASLAAGELLVSFTRSKHKEDALKLARFLVQPEHALALATRLQTVLLPGLGAETTAWYRERPGYTTLYRQLETARSTPDHRDWYTIELCIGSEIWDAMGGPWSAERSLSLAGSCIASNAELHPR